MLYKDHFNQAEDTLCITIYSLGRFSGNMRRQIRWHKFFPCSYFYLKKVDKTTLLSGL